MAGEKTSGHFDAGEQRGVILLSKEEIGKLFGDVVDGLAFLVSGCRTSVDISTQMQFCI